MPSQFESYLPWLLPPVLGAIIGYVTNYIAIRMLFRPFKGMAFFRSSRPSDPGHHPLSTP